MLCLFSIKRDGSAHFLENLLSLDPSLRKLVQSRTYYILDIEVKQAHKRGLSSRIT